MRNDDETVVRATATVGPDVLEVTVSATMPGALTIAARELGRALLAKYQASGEPRKDTWDPRFAAAKKGKK